MGIRKIANESDDDFWEQSAFCSDEESQLLCKDALVCTEANKEKKYPKAVFFILGNELCERFCYYGMRTILTIYLSKELLYSEDSATMIYHLFAMLAYFTPLLGAIIADTWLGKFKTILYISILYAIGNIVLSVGAIPNELSLMKVISIIGLFIIGMGTGGIKPCVSAFGGDQFHHDQQKERERFFSVFYFMINCGSVFSTILTPILRADVKCFGNDSCYPIAFGVPAILMLVALILFIAGKPMYVIEEPKGNILTSVFGCIVHALGNKIKGKKKKEHWLDYAEDKYSKSLIEDIKIVLHILVLYLPLPVFWALFDQTGSRWTLQATKMNGEVLGMNIKADQIQVINPFLILIFIPLFDYVIYPALDKCKLLRKPLQRITVGGILAAGSFVLAGFIELALEESATVLPKEGFSHLTIVNLSPCTVNITGPENRLMKAFKAETVEDLPTNKTMLWTFTTDESCEVSSSKETEMFTLLSPIESMIIVRKDGELKIQKQKDSKEKSDKGESRIRVFFSTDNAPINMTFKFQGTDTYYISPDNMSDSNFGMSQYHNCAPGKYKIYLPVNETSYEENPIGETQFRSGGGYIAGIYKNKEERNFTVIPMVKHNSISILYQVPQYVVLTAAEIMFSITGLEFSYSQAPLSMKSVLQAAWLLTVAFGNLIVFVIAEASLFEKRSWELFMFAILMGLDIFIFAIMAYFYKYVKIHTYSEEKREIAAESKSNGKVNKGYEDETDFNK